MWIGMATYTGPKRKKNPRLSTSRPSSAGLLADDGEAGRPRGAALVTVRVALAGGKGETVREGQRGEGGGVDGDDPHRPNPADQDARERGTDDGGGTRR